MSATETDELVSKVMKTVRIEGELYRAYEKGFDQGLKEGKEIGLEEGKEIGIEEGKEIGLEKGSRDTESKFISKLLEKFTPEEISKDYDVSLQRVYEIQENIKKEK
jgi:flagellar biosynthesis/type III secretory pathway protein FliH